MKKFVSYVVVVNNNGLVFFQAEQQPEFNNPDFIDINEQENTIVFTKKNNSIIFKDIKENIKQAIIKDKGFDLYELDIELNPVKNYRFGEAHKYNNTNKLIKGL